MSFYTSLNGLKNAQTDLGVIAHNIANVETTGFKKGRTEFADIVVASASSNPRMAQGLGARVEAITQNFALGPIEQTGSVLDVAIGGDGFFTMRGPDGSTLYTRNGSFGIDGSGYVNDGSENRVQVFPTDATGTVTSMTPAPSSPASRSPTTARSSRLMPTAARATSARWRSRASSLRRASSSSVRR